MNREAEASALRRVAAAIRAPAADLRVAELVPRSRLSLTEAYLKAGALVRRVEWGEPGEPLLHRSRARPYHDCAALGSLTIGALATAGIEPASQDLFLVLTGPGEVDGAVAELLGALDTEGVVVASGPVASALVRWVEAAPGRGWRLVARDGVVVVQRDRSPRDPRGRFLCLNQGLDRCACVDRQRLAATLAAPMIPLPLPLPLPVAAAEALGSWSAARARLRGLVAAGRGDPELGLALLAETQGIARGRATPGPAPAPERGVDLLIVAPHPDDETVYLGGVIAAAAAAGLRIAVATVTGGEAGLDLRGDPGDLVLETARAQEQRAALRALGAEECRLRPLGFADTGKYTDRRRARPMTAAEALQRWGVDAVVDRLRGELLTLRPQVVIGLDPLCDPNYSLHAHHLATGAALLVAAGEAAARGVGVDLWTVIPSAFAVAEEAASWPRVVVPVDPRRKLAALAAYPSQIYSTQRLIQALEALPGSLPGSLAGVAVSGARRGSGAGVEVLLRRGWFGDRRLVDALGRGAREAREARAPR